MSAVPKRFNATPAMRERFERAEAEFREFATEWLQLTDRAAILLSEIRETGVWREIAPTWDEYVRERWGIGRGVAYRIASHGDTVKAIAKSPDLPAPKSPASTRPLEGLKEETKLKVYSAAVEDAGGEAPTQRQVKAARERIAPKDIVPENATVIITEPEPGGDEPAPEPPRELTDAEWLDTLPAREGLTSYVRDRFDVDALTVRAMLPARDTFRNATASVVKAAEKQLKGHIPPGIRTRNRYLRANPPEKWTACGDCGGSGRMPLTGDCPTCHGNGYHV